MASIRGHMGQFKIFENGAPTDIVDVTNVDVNMKSSFMSTNYVGRPISEGDQSYDGWEGSLDCEVKDASIDKFIDALITNNLNGIGISEYTFTTTESYPDGRTQSYVYYDVQWKMSRKNGGQQEKITKRLEFQAAHRIAL